MSEYFVASTSLASEQSTSALAEVVAEAFGVASAFAQNLFDFSVPAYSTADLLKTVRQSVQKLTTIHTTTLRSQFPSLSDSQISTFAQAQALLQSIKSQPLVRFGIERLRANEWANAQNLLTVTQHQLQRGEVAQAINSARQAQRLLESGLKEVQTRLSSAQHNYGASSAAQVLKEMSYQVQVARSSIGSWTSLWATKGGRAIGVVISSQSQMTVDMLGWEGTSCQAELISFVEGMKKKGIQFRESKRYLHGRKGGGCQHCWHFR